LSPRGRAALLTAAYYATVFAALGAFLPYWPVWLESRGLDEATIGWFLGAAMLARIVGATVLPALSDRHAIRRAMVTLTATFSAATGIALLALPTDPGLLLLTSLFWAVAMTPSVTLGEALGLRAAGRHGFAYAPIRAAGSMGFLLANLGVGALLDRIGPDVALWAVAAGFLGVAALGAVHPGGGAPPEVGADRARPADWRRLLTNRAFAIFVAAMAANQASHVVYYGYSTLDWRAQGIGGATIGQLWALGVLAETALMLGPGRAIVARLGMPTALRLAAATAALRWGAMAAGPDLGWLWFLQALHAITFGLGHLAAMAFLLKAIPPRLAGSAQGFLSGIGGCAGALMLFAAGGLVAWGGIGAGYCASAGLAAVSVAATTWLAVVWRGERVVAD